MVQIPATGTPAFLPIADKKLFPFLASGHHEPCATLMACDNLEFFALDDLATSSTLKHKKGRDWHMYGDSRWPSPAVWVEVPSQIGKAQIDCGILVMRADLPPNVEDHLIWCVRNNPLAQVLPQERSEDVFKARLQMLRLQAATLEQIAEPIEKRIGSVQSYCIFHRDDNGEPQLSATYTDVLNIDGVPLPLYRMASVRPDHVPLCRMALHLLFCLNEARLANADFISIPQFSEFRPKLLHPGQVRPKWVQFHSARVLRTRPFLRAASPPNVLKDGILFLADFERVSEITRRETCSHLLAFAREARPRDMAIHQNSANAALTAFVHRANGGVIYVLPDNLVEEFDNTDCSEVLLEDLNLPFPNLFLKFTPPRQLILADDAHVDGCYIVKQGDEFMLILTSRLPGVDYEHSLSVVATDPTFSLHMPATTPGLSLSDAVEEGVRRFLLENAPPEDDLSTSVQRPDGTHTAVVDRRAESRKRRIRLFREQEPVFRACLNIVVNAACFIAFRPEDISDGWEGEPPEELISAATENATSRRKRDKKRDALKRLEAGDFTRIRICGKDLFSREPDDGIPGSGISPRAHWRRGHWRRQRHGVGLTLIALKWIRPTIVRKDAGPVVESRIYEVGEQREQ